MNDLIVDFLKLTGAAGLMFGAFYLYHQATTKQLNDIITGTFEILKTLINQNNLGIGYMQEIRSLILNNTWCPYIRAQAGVKPRGACGQQDPKGETIDR